ncbi:exo-alpha-sialidase [Sphingobacteriales bacterium UPWRP_1]|nr:hypothetical protein BVG80_04695 [Sphingobacteriales bacterium TSM_CSM]PSJ73686.1 exo-alpha-sialidase [Sphingobacteriales bacterium UPWRP_1]
MRTFFYVSLFLCSLAVFAQPAAYIPKGIAGWGAIYSPSFSPYNPNELYIACDMSGLYHSTDLGASFQVADFRQLKSHRGGRVVFTNDSSMLYTIDYTSSSNAKPAKSINGGNTWTPLTWNYGRSLYIFGDINRNDRIVVGTASGIYFSGNGGSSFTNIYTNTNNVHIAGAFFDPNGNDIYIATKAGLLVSNNSGTNFAFSALGGFNQTTENMVSFSGAKQNGILQFYCVTMDPASVYPDNPWPASVLMGYRNVYEWTSGDAAWNPFVSGFINANDKFCMVAMAQNDISTVYLTGAFSVTNNTGGKPAVYKSVNGGAWQSVFLYLQNQNIYTGYRGHQGDFDWWAIWTGITVAPFDKDKVCLTDMGEAHLTTDGGTTWAGIYLQPADRNNMGVWGAATQNRYYHSNGLETTVSRWLTWCDPQTIWACYDDIGCSRSIDGGNTWGFTYNGILGNVQSEECQNSVLTADGTLYTCTGNCRGIMYGPLVLSDAQIDPYGGLIYKSTDKGANWTVLKNFGRPVTWIALNPGNPDQMFAMIANYANGDGGLWVTNNLSAGASATWTHKPNPPRTEGHTLNVLVLNDGNLVTTYSARRDAGGNFTASAGVFISTDGGNSWIDRTAPEMQYYTTNLTIDPSDTTQQTWYTGVETHWNCPGGCPDYAGVYKTTDRGQNWTRIFPASGSGIAVYEAKVNPYQPNQMYICSMQNGLYYTNNLNAATPAFTQDAAYPFEEPMRVFFNPYNPAEVWVCSNGNGLRMGKDCSNLVPVITGNGNVCPNNTETYSVPAIAGSTYTWTVTGGAIISGQGTNQITVQWSGGTTGTVSVQQQTP